MLKTNFKCNTPDCKSYKKPSVISTLRIESN